MKYHLLTPSVLVATLVLVFTASEIVVGKSSNIRSYKLLEGDNLLVICNVTNSSDTDIYWTKNDTDSTFMQEGKRLEIINIKRSYSGDYICHSLNTSFPVPEYNETDANVTIEVINIDVQYAAEIDNFTIGPDELMENETFYVTCAMEANPNPIWTIRNRNTGRHLVTALGPANVTFGPVKVGCDDMGYWECTGSNVLNHGVNVTKGHNITVYCSPRPQHQRNEYVVKAKEGQYTILTMHLLAYPRANFTWTKDDGTAISNAAKQDDFGQETLLTFPMISVPDFGNYTLKMQNEFGTYFAHYKIDAYGPPKTPTSLNFSDVTYNSVKLQWTSGFDMGSTQHFIVMKLIGNQFIQVSNNIYDNSTNHGINQNWTYVLTSLVSDTNYNLTVVSVNERGFMSGFAKPSVSFRTSKYPKTKESSKIDVKLIVGLTLGTIATVIVLAFMAYVVRARRLRSSYTTMNR